MVASEGDNKNLGIIFEAVSSLDFPKSQQVSINAFIPYSIPSCRSSKKTLYIFTPPISWF